MDKVIRDGKVAVLYSPGFGAGWYTWNTGHPQCLYDPEVVAWLEEDLPEEEFPNLEAKYGEYFYDGGWRDLVIAWLPVGTRFWITEYDGSENLVLESEHEWQVA